MKSLTPILLLLALLGLSACSKDVTIVIEMPPLPNYSSVHRYLFLGHIYEDQATVDPRIEFANLGAYQQIWLGGDICAETTQEETTLDYLDDLFDLDNPNTHWTLGNHDVRNGNENWITSRTKRKTFYTAHSNGITLLVLNSTLREPEECERLAEQYDLIQSVCDTIQASSHLVVLTHHVVWGGVDPAIQVNDFANANGSWIDFLCGSPSNRRFEHSILPELIKVQERGTSVICIAGDLGQVASGYEFTNEDGILFLGSGITSETNWHQQFPTAGQRDKVLELLHNIESRQLTWRFINIEDI